MKIALMLGRGIDGCGATKNLCGLKRYFEQKNYTTDVFTTSDKIWGRRYAHELDVLSECKYSEISNVVEVFKQLSTYDLVVVYSVPSTKHNPDCIKNFTSIIKNLKVPKILIQVDHSIHSITRNANLVETCNNVDLMFAHSLEGDFAKWLTKHNIEVPLCEFVGGYDYEEQRQKYWLPIEAIDTKAFKFIGRSAMWKGPELVYDMHREYLKDMGFLTTLEGMELSIGGLRFFFKDGLRANGSRDDIIECLGKNSEYNFDNITHGNPAYVFGPYNFDDCMKRVAKTGFGADLYNLKPEKYGKSIENCHCDVIGAGSIPVFHKHFGQHCKSLVTGKPYIEHENTGTIWVDDNNIKEVCEFMNTISNYPKAMDKLREQAYKFWKEHTDYIVTYDYLCEQIKEKLGIEL